MSFGTIPLSPDDKPDGFVLLSRYEKLESENTKLRDLMYERAHVYAIQYMTEAELRIVATNVMEDNAKLRELVCHLYEYRQLYFKTGIYPTDHGVTEQRMRELGVEYSDNG